MSREPLQFVSESPDRRRRHPDVWEEDWKWQVWVTCANKTLWQSLRVVAFDLKRLHCREMDWQLKAAEEEAERELLLEQACGQEEEFLDKDPLDDGNP